MAETRHEPIPEATEEVGAAVVEAAFRVHRKLGPGLLESVCETCLCHELRKAALDVKSQVAVPITYDGVELKAGLRLDILVADRVIVEVKAVEVLVPVHTAQVLTYLRLAGRRLGFLINFTVPLLKDGLHRIVN